LTAVGPALEITCHVAESWLFSKGPSSVRITRTSSLALAVCGPGRVRRFLNFLSDSELVMFLRDTEYALSSAGFRFKGYAADRRQSADRREETRGIERRGPAPW
jgi:hypothetical protein